MVSLVMLIVSSMSIYASNFINFNPYTPAISISTWFHLFQYTCRCIDYIQVNTAQGDTISDNCGTDKSDLDGEVFPFGENIIMKNEK